MAFTSTATPPISVNNEIVLIGPMALDLLSTTLKQLSIIKQVLQRFLYHMREIGIIWNASHMKMEDVVHGVKLTFIHKL